MSRLLSLIYPVVNAGALAIRLVGLSLRGSVEPAH